MAKVNGKAGALVLAGFALGILFAHVFYPGAALEILISEGPAAWISAVFTVVAALAVFAIASRDRSDRALAERRRTRAQGYALLPSILDATAKYGVVKDIRARKPPGLNDGHVSFLCEQFLAIRLDLSGIDAIDVDLLGSLHLLSNAIQRDQFYLRQIMAIPSDFGLDRLTTLIGVIERTETLLYRCADVLHETVHPGVAGPWRQVPG